MRPTRNNGLRWMFLACGLLLLFGHHFTLHSLLRSPHWSIVFFPESHSRQLLFRAAVILALIPSGSLCLLTSWGMKRHRGWSRWTGMAASLFLLCGFPW